MSNPKNDDELMLLVQRGSAEAFTVLFQRHSSSVFGLCMRFFAGNRARSEDISQEVWAKVVVYARTYKPEGKFKSWLLQVTRNASLREIQKNQAHYNVSEEVDVASDFNLEDTLIENYREAEVKAAIDRLPDAQRAALILWVDGAKNYEEIAAQMKTTVSSVKSLLFRARQSLLEKLKVDV